MRLLVAGGAGFIGSNFVRHVLNAYPDYRVTVLDALTYAGNLESLRDVADDPRYRFVHGWIQDAECVSSVIEADRIDAIVNFAAESHNDRSLLEAGSFIQTDVFGVHVLLQQSRKHGLARIVHVSTDEVYGTTAEGSTDENAPLEPNTPYSASKAGGDLQCRVHHIAFGTPVIVTRGANTYGPYQYPEKLVPFFAVRMLAGKKAPLYGDGMHVRQWLHVEDHCTAIDRVLHAGAVGEVYNVGAKAEVPNRELVGLLVQAVGCSPDLVLPIPDPRGAAHDRRYSVTSDKLRALGWSERHELVSGIAATVEWYRTRADWWRPIVESEPYRDFVTAFYGPLLGEHL